MIIKDLIVNSIGYHQGHPVSPHMHVQEEFLVPEREEYDVVCGEQRFHLKPGQVLYLPPRCVHDQSASQGTSYYIKLNGLIGYCGSSPKLFVTDEAGLLLKWCQDMWHCTSRSQDHSEQILHALTSAWAHQFLAVNQLEQDQRQREPAVQRAKMFLQEHYDRDLSLAEIAASTGVSASHLRFLFRQHEEMSVMDYLRSIRMQHARRLLRDDYLSVAEVGEQVGYADPNYFARQFRSVHQHSPRAWRKQQASV